MSPNRLDPEESFEKLFNLPLDLISIAGLDGYLKKINPSFSTVLGYSEAQLLATPFIDLIHPDDLKPTLQAIERLKQGHIVVNFENRYRHLNGSYRTLSWSSSYDQQKERIFSIARDITNERHYQHQLSQIHKVLNSETIVAMTDEKGNITEVNEQFCKISGYSRSELLGKNHRIINSGKHSRAFFKNMWDTISAGKIWSGEIENRAKNGEHYFVQTIITPIFDTQGEICNFLSIRFDITQHVRDKAMLHKTLEILSETGAKAKVGGWEMDVKSQKLSWTDETFNILGVEKNDSMQPNLSEGIELFTFPYKPVVEKAVMRAIEFGESYDIEVEALTPQGKTLWVHTTGKANYKHGKIVTLSGTIQDIDARKKAEKLLEFERVKNIRNAKLASLGELAAGVAHEINNPLAIIDGSVKLIPKFIEKPDKVKYYIQNIEKSCSRISRIVSSLKKFSRSNESHQFGEYRLKDIVKESILLTNTKANRHGTDISLVCESNAVIRCDEIEIEQVVINLINNAIDAVKNLPEKWVKLELKKDENHLLLKVKDSGLGIAPIHQERIFDPFYTTKKNGEGTGLGLSITKGILDEHKASISIEKNTLHTCFIVSFPLLRD
jgi:PAS domain S-box-containing protein